MKTSEIEIKLSKLSESFNQDDFLAIMKYFFPVNKDYAELTYKISNIIESVIEKDSSVRKNIQLLEIFLIFYYSYNFLPNAVRIIDIISDNFSYDELSFTGTLNIGTVYFYRGEYEKAYKALLISLEKAEDNNSLTEKSDVLKVLGFVYRNEKEYEKALDSFNEHAYPEN